MGVKISKEDYVSWAKEVKATREYLRNGGVDGPIQAIEKDDKIEFGISPPSNKRTMGLLKTKNKTGILGVILFDTKSGLQLVDKNGNVKEDENGDPQIQPPALGFLHEAAHANYMREDQEAQLKRENSGPTNGFPNKEEEKVVNEIETPAAKKLGLPHCEDY